MIFALVSFFISLLVIAAMILNKIREHNTGKAFVSVNQNLDQAIRDKIVIFKKITTELPRHFGREALYSFIHKIVLLSRKIKEKLHPKIGHIIDAVKGKDIPKNKGAASFFLLHIKKHKDSMGSQEN